MFLATKMWIDTLINKYASVSESIPRDIGNQVLMQSNLFMTKKGISMYIIVNEWSEETDYSFTSACIDFVKSQVPNVEINFIYKCYPKTVNIKSPEVEANIELWSRVLNRELKDQKEFMIKRAARCMATVDVIKSGARLLDVQTIIEVRGMTYKDTYRAHKVLRTYLQAQDIEFTKLDTDLKRYIPFIKLVNDSKQKVEKEVPKALFSTNTLSKILPTVQGINNDNGVYMGQDILNYSPYYIDFTGDRAKNMYILGESGSGKTFAALYMLTMAALKDYNISVSDIKGDEFTGLINSIGGKIVSLRVVDDTFVNIWRLDRDKADEPEYFRRMQLYNEQFLRYIMDPTPEEEVSCNSFIATFMRMIYLRLGVTKNPNTWGRTVNLHPHQFYDYLIEFMSDDIRTKYKDLAKKAEQNFKEFLSPKGSMSYLFTRELDYSEIVKSKYISFDFGMLASGLNVDNKVAANIKNLFHNIINDDFIVYKNKYFPKTKTIIIEEESQLVSKEVLRQYAFNFTIRRAQKCINVLLGNSMRALLEVEEAKAIFDNINIVMIGKISEDNKQMVKRYFDLNDKAIDCLKAISNNKATDTSYFYIRDNSKESIDTIINPRVSPKYVKTCKIFNKELNLK